jgi:hypothetical protein
VFFDPFDHDRWKVQHGWDHSLIKFANTFSSGTFGPARARHLRTVTVTAGQVQAELEMKNRLPAVCSAIGCLTLIADGGQIGVTEALWLRARRHDRPWLLQRQLPIWRDIADQDR